MLKENNKETKKLQLVWGFELHDITWGAWKPLTRCFTVFTLPSLLSVPAKLENCDQLLCAIRKFNEIHIEKDCMHLVFVPCKDVFEVFKQSCCTPGRRVEYELTTSYQLKIITSVPFTRMGAFTRSSPAPQWRWDAAAAAAAARFWTDAIGQSQLGGQPS